MTLTQALLAFALAAGVSVVTVPAGVSGAVFLLPAQISVLGIPSPAVTPTNLLYNVIATPAAIVRFRRAESASLDLARPVLVGALPGVVIGAVLRTTVASGGGVFRVLVGVLLLLIGARLLGREERGSGPQRLPRSRELVLLGLATGVVGGLYGIGGGSVLAPILAMMGFALIDVAPAALLVTFVTSVAGVGAFVGLSQLGASEAEPDWTVGVALGLGGLVGGYLGAGLQPYIPETTLRRLLGGLAALVGLGYLIVAVT